MKTPAIVILAILATGCASKPNDDGDWKTWSLRRHLDTKSEWGAVQGGISISLRETGSGIVLVVRNDGAASVEIDPFFHNGYNVEIEAYDENRMPLTDLEAPTFATRMPSPLVKLEPGEEFASEPIGTFPMARYKPPARTAFLVAVWFRNMGGTDLRGPVITGPLALRNAG